VRDDNFMKLNKLCCLLFVLTITAEMFSQSPSARDELNLGTAAFRQGKFQEAVQHCRNAVALDDKNIQARLYLASALAEQYVPGVDTPDNKQMGNDAIDEYQQVLALAPENLDSIKGVASLNFQMKEFDKAKEYYRRAIALDPNNTESYFGIGVIDWTQVYTLTMELRTKFELKQDIPLIGKSECWTLRSTNEELVQDGMEMFTHALNLRPTYDDAMAYLNLLYRERANIQCGDRAAYNADLEQADKWVDMTMAVKK
jgi:tetratricopeptide (TPR) repeat protein